MELESGVQAQVRVPHSSEGQWKQAAGLVIIPHYRNPNRLKPIRMWVRAPRWAMIPLKTVSENNGRSLVITAAESDPYKRLHNQHDATDHLFSFPILQSKISTKQKKTL